MIQSDRWTKSSPRRAQQRVFSSREASAMHSTRTEAEVQEAVRQAEQVRDDDGMGWDGGRST